MTAPLASHSNPACPCGGVLSAETGRCETCKLLPQWDDAPERRKLYARGCGTPPKEEGDPVTAFFIRLASVIVCGVALFVAVFAWMHTKKRRAKR